MVNLSKRLQNLEAQIHPPEEFEQRARRHRRQAAITSLLSTMRMADARKVHDEVLPFWDSDSWTETSPLSSQFLYHLQGAEYLCWPHCLKLPGEIAELWRVHEVADDGRDKKDWLQCVECFSGVPYFKQHLLPGACVMADGKWNIQPIPEFRYTDKCLLCGGRLADWFDVRWGRA